MASASDTGSGEAGLPRAASPDKPPVIAHLLPHFDDGIIGRAVLDIATATLSAGGRAIVVSTGGRLASRLAALGGKNIEMTLDTRNPLAQRRNADQLAQVIEREGIHIIHAHNRAPAWCGYRAAQRTDARFVTTYDRAYENDALLKRRYNAVMAKGAPTIAVSDHIAGVIRAQHGVPADRIVTVARGIDPALFDPDAMTGGRIIQLTDRWGLTDEPRPVFLLPGSLTAEKGQAVFVDACALLRTRRGPDFVGLMVGDAPLGAGMTYADGLEKRAMQHGCADVVKIAGTCLDMPAAYRLASCVVSAATTPEAFDRVAVEAQAMGRAVIGTNHGSLPEIVEDGLTGALVAPGDAETMAEAMNAFLDLDDATRDRIGERARMRAVEHFSTDRMQAAMMRVYERATGLRFPVG